MNNTLLPNHIISVDDLGLTPLLDTIVLEILKTTVIDRVSILVDQYDVTELCAQLKKESVAKDIHLNLTETGDNSPIFLRRLKVLGALYTNPQHYEAVRKVWESQITIFINIFGHPPDGLNSHEHVHLHPRLFPLALELAEKYNIPYIRHGIHSFVTHDYRPHLFRYWHKKTAGLLQHRNIQTSAALYSFDWEHMRTDEIEQRIPLGSEIIFHPQYKADVVFLLD